MDFDLSKASSRLSELDLRIAAGNFTMNALWFRAMICNCEGIIERHTHSTVEFHFVYAGSTRVVLDNSSFEVKAGEFYLTAPGVYHRQEYRNNYIEFSLNCELSVTGEPAYEAHHIVSMLQTAECRPVADTAGAIGIFYKVLEEAYFQNTGFYNNITSLSVMLVVAACRAMNGAAHAEYSVPLKQKKAEFRFIQIRDFIRDNVTLPISTTDISRHIFLGEKQISRIVREACGMSTKELILECKFREAKNLLIGHQDLSIRQIAEMLGFSSEYYFNQFFKRREGYPPGVFRRNVRNP